MKRQTFSTKVAGVTHHNQDGSNRQEILSRCKTGQSIQLVREADNPYDQHAIAVVTKQGKQLGYMPGGDYRLAEHMDKGGQVSARIVAVTGGPGCLGGLFKSQAKNYGCVIEVTKVVK